MERGKEGTEVNEVQVSSGYIVLSAVGFKTRRVPVRTGDEATAIWNAFRDGNGIGSSDLKRDSGNIYGSDGKLVARVSYNGRIWSPDGVLLQEPDGMTCPLPVGTVMANL